MNNFENTVPLLVPDIPGVNKLIPWFEMIEESKHYTNFGPLNKKLLNIFAEKFQVESEEVTLIANATLAMELVLHSLGLPEKSNILIPAFTFVATATAVIRAGHQPVLADVDEDSWLLTPEIAQQACQSMRIDAVIPVATFGMPHDMRAWENFENKNKIPVVIDAAAAYGSQWLNGCRGTLVFSLHATKSLPAIEGAVVVSSRKDLIKKITQNSNFGINLNPKSIDKIGELNDSGTNAKMSEYHAAICLSSLEDWDDRSMKRRIIFDNYKKDINSISGDSIRWQQPGSGGGIFAPTLMPLVFKSNEIRSKLEKICIEKKITTRRWYQPLISEMNELKGKFIALKIPKSLELSKKLLGLPFYIDIKDSDKQRVLSAIREALQ